MKLLLTSAGIHNPSIHAALVELLPKPIADSNALVITTSSYGHPMVTPQMAWKFVAGQEPDTPMVELGWNSVGLLELTALPSLADERWQPWIRKADVLLVNGGDPMYLSYWMQESGLAALFPSLDDLVYVGLSAGSMIMAPSIGEDFVHWSPPGGGDTTLGLVDFSIFPHLDNPDLPDNTLATAERWAAIMPRPVYALDDESALKIVDGRIEVISEGHWKLFDA